VKVLHSFEAFGKRYDVVDAPSEETFRLPSLASFAKSNWRKIERNRE
jgi:hypothetical protein